jgi:hypothetical protein
MDQAGAKESGPQAAEYRCIVCGELRRQTEPCCATRIYGGLGPRDYVELLWDEA